MLYALLDFNAFSGKRASCLLEKKINKIGSGLILTCAVHFSELCAFPAQMFFSLCIFSSVFSVNLELQFGTIKCTTKFELQSNFTEMMLFHANLLNVCIAFECSQYATEDDFFETIGHKPFLLIPVQ